MVDKGYLQQKIISVLETVYDPEIPVNIYELGMIYDVKIDDNAIVNQYDYQLFIREFSAQAGD